MNLPDEIPEIDVDGAAGHLQAEDALFIDIRDPQSFSESHIPGAIQLDEQTVQPFLADTAKDRRLIVYCYHGNSSLGGGGVLSGERVFSGVQYEWGVRGLAWEASGGVVGWGVGWFSEAGVGTGRVVSVRIVTVVQGPPRRRGVVDDGKPWREARAETERLMRFCQGSPLALGDGFPGKTS